MAKLFSNAHPAQSRAGLARIQADLADTLHIITSSVSALLSRGEALDKLEEKSSTLLRESKAFDADARRYNCSWFTIVDYTAEFLRFIASKLSLAKHALYNMLKNEQMNALRNRERDSIIICENPGEV